jgi:hypothetical protein
MTCTFGLLYCLARGLFCQVLARGWRLSFFLLGLFPLVANKLSKGTSSSNNMPTYLLIEPHLYPNLEDGPFNVTPKLNKKIMGAHLIRYP